MLGRDRGLPGHGGGVANDVIFRPVVAVNQWSRAARPPRFQAVTTYRSSLNHGYFDLPVSRGLYRAGMPQWFMSDIIYYH